MSSDYVRMLASINTPFLELRTVILETWVDTKGNYKSVARPRNLTW